MFLSLSIVCNEVNSNFDLIRVMCVQYVAISFCNNVWLKQNN